MALVSDLVLKAIPANQAAFLGDTTAAGLVAVGTNAATAFPISASINEFVTVTPPTAFCALLPLITATPYTWILIKNDSVNTLTVFPDPTNSINALALGALINIAGGGSLTFYKASSTLWVST